MAGRLSDEERIDWLRLIRTDGIGPRTFRALVNRFGGAAGALEALPGLAGRRGRPGKLATRAEAAREIEEASRRGIRFVAFGEPDYPRPLQAVDTAPPLLAVRGSVAVLSRPTVAIVGSRNASAAGLAFTERLARDLGAAGYVVVSGLARGIDARAHRAALATGTVAVLAGGHERASTRATTRRCSSRSSPTAAPRSPRCRSHGSRAAATSRAATASSRDCPTASSWSRRRGARGR